MTIHPLVRRAAVAYLAMADAVAPSWLEALYVVGSAAMDDFRPGLSDLNFVAVTASTLADDMLRDLAEAHARLNGDRGVTRLDGLYVTWDELRTGPISSPEGPCVDGGRFIARGRHARHPMTWSVLRDDAVTVRGPLCAGAFVWRDPASLGRWLAASVDGHWRPWLSRVRAGLDREESTLLDGAAVEDAVLGLCRLHYALAIGRVPSKSDAGLYGLISFPTEWHRVVDEALRIRRETGGEPRYLDDARRREDVLDFAGFVLDDARALQSGGVTPADGRHER